MNEVDDLEVIQEVYSDHYKSTSSIFLFNSVSFPFIWFLFDYLMNEKSTYQHLLKIRKL